MQTILITYLAIGLLANIIGPLAIKIRKGVDKVANPIAHFFLDEVEKPPKWKVLLFEVTLRLLALIFFPLLYVILSIDHFREKAYKQKRANEKADHRLYFSRMGGYGHVHCLSCGFRQGIVSFTHGEPGTSTTGYQCQDCGQFVATREGYPESKALSCTCKGKLSRDKPLFCPKCSSENMRYDLEYVT